MSKSAAVSRSRKGCSKGSKQQQPICSSSLNGATEYEYHVSVEKLIGFRATFVGETPQHAQYAADMLLKRLQRVFDQPVMTKTMCMQPGSVDWEERSLDSARPLTATPAAVAAPPPAAAGAAAEALGPQLKHMLKPIQTFMAARSNSRNAGNNIVSAVRTTLRQLQVADPDSASVEVVLQTLAAAEQGVLNAAVRYYKNACYVLHFLEYCAHCECDAGVLQRVRSKVKAAAAFYSTGKQSMP
jgi:hypothetical protein